jgi:hypothetical protein
VALPVTTSIIVGAVPAVILGSFLSSRVPDSYLRPAIGFVIFASGLKYIGVDVHTLGWILLSTAVAVAAAWYFKSQPRRRVGLPVPSKADPEPGLADRSAALAGLERADRRENAIAS